MLVLSRDIIDSYIDEERIVEAVRRALNEIDRVIMPDRMVLIDGEHWWGIMPCIYPSKLFITKIVNIIPENRSRGLSTINGVIVVFDGANGEPLAIMDARAITACRTAAMCSIVAKLWSGNVETVSIIGTGFQARYIVKFLMKNIRFSRLVLYNRSIENLRKFSRFLEDLGVDHEVAENIRRAHDADIVIESTTAREPVIRGSYLEDRDRWLIISIGVSGPSYSTVDEKALDVSQLIVVDRLSSVLREVGDLKNYEKHRSKVIELPTILKTGEDLRRYRRVLFKSVGIAVLDLYTVTEVLRKAGENIVANVHV
ncbi:MAG: ornithine cyclodeaminase family protein [Crenarchaeota archaeon]|nr:ornithine cyclodeaminase family protein [Thermoproteota archaeon]